MGLFSFSCRVECPRHVAVGGVISGANNTGLACVGWNRDGDDARKVYTGTFFLPILEK